MDYRGFLNLIRARWLVLVTFALIGTIAAAGLTLTRQVDYSAQAELFVAAVGGDSSSDLAQGSNYSQQQARNYSVLATRQVVLDPVINNLDLGTTTRELASRVTASVPLNTSVITISVSDTSPEGAADTANSIATSLVNTVIRLVPKRTDGTTPVRLETIQSATPPSVSSAPGRVILLVGGLLAGLVAGIALIVLRELGSARLRNGDQILQMDDLPLLGSVVHDRSTNSSPLVRASSSGSPRFEEFRQIRTNLPQFSSARGENIVAVTSSIPGEGRSITAANLALAIAGTGRSVCLVEGDLRRPSLSRYFDSRGTPGLTNVLAGQASLDESLVEVGDGLTLLAAGPVPENPSELLASDRTSLALGEVSRRFDVVLIDTPAILPVTDAAVLAKAAGRAIVVVRTSRVEVRELHEALDTLEASNVDVLGAILNDVPARAAGRYRGAYVRTRRERQLLVQQQVAASAPRPRGARAARVEGGADGSDPRDGDVVVATGTGSELEAPVSASASSDPAARNSRTYRVSKDSATHTD